MNANWINSVSTRPARHGRPDRKRKARRLFYEVLADAFDFAGPDLWKSNSFASLRPRLAIHVRHVIAKLESSLACEIRRGRSKPFCGLGATAEQRKVAAAYRTSETSAAIQKLQLKLDPAREVLSRLEAAEAPR